MNEVLQSRMNRQQQAVRRVQMHRFDLLIRRPTSLRFPLFVLRRGSPTTHLSAPPFHRASSFSISFWMDARLMRRSLDVHSGLSRLPARLLTSLSHPRSKRVLFRAAGGYQRCTSTQQQRSDSRDPHRCCLFEQLLTNQSEATARQTLRCLCGMAVTTMYI